MKSWKTTSAGVIGLLVIVLSAARDVMDGNPATNPDWAVVIAALQAAFIGFFARDKDVSSEAQGLKS